MKKYIALLLALALALGLLTSCELMAPGPTERPPIGGAEPTGSAGPSPSQTLWQEGTGPDFDRRFSQFSSTSICTTEDTVYFIAYGTNLIQYVDKATGICLPLCGKPECTHDNDNCNAYVRSSLVPGVASYDGRLYWLDRVPRSLMWSIYSTAYNGTDRREGRVLDKDAAGYLQSQLHRGYLYVSYVVQDVVNAIPKDTVYVDAYPIDSDGEKVRILCKEVDNLSQNVRIQAYGDSVYIAVGVDEEGSNIELYRWDTRAGALETLYRGDVPFYWSREFWVTEDGITLYGDVPTGPEEDSWASRERNIYQLSFEDGEIRLLYKFWMGERLSMNVTLSDGVVIANWTTDSGGVRYLVKDFMGQTVLDAAFEGEDWYSSGTGCGMDENYLYFVKFIDKFMAVSRDGSEIKLLWSRGSGNS